MKRDLARPIIYCISEGDITVANFPRKIIETTEKVRKAADVGISLFQIREKSLPADLLFELVSAAVAAADATGLGILVNGRFDIAMSCDADGVHLPADGLPVNRVREMVGGEMIIASSVHSEAEANEAKAGGADLLAFGPIFSTPGKGPSVGLNALGELCKLVEPLPVLALGGVSHSDLETVCSHGAAGFAAIRSLNSLIDGREN